MNGPSKENDTSCWRVIGFDGEKMADFMHREPDGGKTAE